MSIADGLLDSDALAEPLQWVLALEFLKLHRRVLIEKLVNREVTTADLDQDLVFLNFDADATGAKLVDALRLSQKHDLEFLSVRVVIDVLGKLHVDNVALDWDVDGNPGLEVDNVAFESLVLRLKVSDTLKQLK